MANIGSNPNNNLGTDLNAPPSSAQFNALLANNPMLLARAGPAVETLIQQIPQAVSRQGNTLRIVYESGQVVSYPIATGGAATTASGQVLSAAQAGQALRSASAAPGFASTLARLGTVARNSILTTIATELLFPQNTTAPDYNYTQSQVDEQLGVLQGMQASDTTGSLVIVETQSSNGPDLMTTHTLQNKHTGVPIASVDQRGGLQVNPHLQDDLSFTPWNGDRSSIPLNANTTNGAPGSIVPLEDLAITPPAAPTVVQPTTTAPTYDPTEDFNTLQTTIQAAATGNNGGFTVEQVQGAAERALGAGVITQAEAQQALDLRMTVDANSRLGALANQFSANTTPGSATFAANPNEVADLVNTYSYLADAYQGTPEGTYYSDALAQAIQLAQIADARDVVSGFVGNPASQSYDAVNNALYLLRQRDPGHNTNDGLDGVLDDIQQTNRNRRTETGGVDTIPDPWDEPITTPSPTPSPQPDPGEGQPLLPPATPPNQPLLPAGPDHPTAPNPTPDNPWGVPGTTQGDQAPISAPPGNPAEDPWTDPTPQTGGGESGGVTPPNLPPTGGGGGNAGNGDDNSSDPPESNQNWAQRLQNFWQQTTGSFAQRSQQFQTVVGQTIKTVGSGLAAANAAGGVGAAAFYTGLRENRTTNAVDADNAAEELQNLQADPDAYIQENYTNEINVPGAGIAIGDHLYNMSGHLLEVTNGDGSVYHFRRVPEDMFNALQANQEARGLVSNSVFVPEVVTLEGGEEAAVWVEIRPPARAEGARNVDVSLNRDENRTNGGFGIRPEIRIGPQEGQQAVLGGELNVGRYQSGGNSTRLRVGFPSASGNNLGIGIRQQETRSTLKVGLGGGTLRFNESRVRDLSDPDSFLNGSSLVVANGRAYLDFGDRSRVRLDGSLTDGVLPQDPFGRTRLTGFAELGLGADFVKYVWGDGQYVSANGYLEAQAYLPDARLQAGTAGSSAGVRQAPGFVDPSKLFEIDPALQLSTNLDAIPDLLIEDRAQRLLGSEDVLTGSSWGTPNPLAGNVDLVGRLQSSVLTGEAQENATVAFNNMSDTTEIELANGTEAQFRTDGTKSFVVIPETGQIFDVTGSNALSASSLAYDATTTATPQLISSRVPLFYGAEQVQSPSFGSRTTAPLSIDEAPTAESLSARGATVETVTLADQSEVQVFTVRDENGNVVETYGKTQYGGIDLTFEMSQADIDALPKQMLAPYTSPDGDLTPALIAVSDLESTGGVTADDILFSDDARRLSLPQGGRVHYGTVNGKEMALYQSPNGETAIYDASIFDQQTLNDYFNIQGELPSTDDGILFANATGLGGVVSDMPMQVLPDWPNLTEAPVTLEGLLETMPENTDAGSADLAPLPTPEQPAATLDELLSTLPNGNDIQTRMTASLPELQDGVLTSLAESGTDIDALNTRLGTNLDDPAKRNWQAGMTEGPVDNIYESQQGQYDPAGVTASITNPDGSQTLVLDNNTSVARDGTVILRNDSGDMIASIAPSGQRTDFENMRPVETDPAAQPAAPPVLNDVPSIALSTQQRLDNLGLRLPDHFTNNLPSIPSLPASFATTTATLPSATLDQLLQNSAITMPLTSTSANFSLPSALQNSAGSSSGTQNDSQPAQFDLQTMRLAGLD